MIIIITAKGNPVCIVAAFNAGSPPPINKTAATCESDK